MDLKRPLLPTYCTMDKAGPDGAILWIWLAVVILRRWKVVRCVQFYWTSKKTLCLALEYVKNFTGSIVHCFRLLSWSDFGSKDHKVWPPTRDSSYKVTYSFWLCVHTMWPSVCAPSFVVIVWCKWVLRVFAFRVRKTPQIVSRNLKAL